RYRRRRHSASNRDRETSRNSRERGESSRRAGRVSIRDEGSPRRSMLDRAFSSRPSHVKRPRVMRVAWLFPGQGSQEVGMGKALAASSPAAKRALDGVDAALGFALSTLSFDGPIEELT